MGYYMAGDYYMAGGLFGFVGKALGGIAKTVGGAVGGLLTTGTPLGAIGGALKGAGIIKTAAPTPTEIAIPYGGPMISQAAPGVGVTAPGYRVNAQGMVVPKRRRMNPANPRALRRAIRREESFIRLARKTGLVTVPKTKRIRKATAKRGR